jgi:chromosome segregation ATPase
MNLSSFLTSIRTTAGPLPWQTWLALSEAAASADEWRSAWGALDPAEQRDVIARLAAERNVFADTLLLQATDHAAVLESLRSRGALLHAAAGACPRLSDRIEVRLLELRGLAPELRAAVNLDQAEAALRVTQLETELSGLKGGVLTADHARLVALIEELSVWRERAAGVAAFDAAAAQRELDGLRADTEQLTAQQSLLEGDLGAARSERDSLATQVLAGERARLELGTAVAALRKELQEATAAIEGSESEQARLRADLDRNSAEAQRVIAQRSALEAQAHEKLQSLRSEQARLAELSATPVVERAAELNRLIDALYVEFPPDQADFQLATR